MILEIAGIITLVALCVLLVIGTILFVGMCFDNNTTTESNRSRLDRIEDAIERLDRKCNYTHEKLEGLRKNIKNV